MEVTLKLGSNMTVSPETMFCQISLTPTLQESEALQYRLKAASSAMKGALASMDTKEDMMRSLETGTKYLGLLVSLGKNVAEVCFLALSRFCLA